MSKRVIKQLSDMSIDEVSLVDRGANQHALISIAKRYDVADAFAKARGGHTNTSNTGDDDVTLDEAHGDDPADVVDEHVSNGGKGDTGAPAGKTISGTQKVKGEDITGTAGKARGQKTKTSVDFEGTKDTVTASEETNSSGEKNLPAGLKESTGDKVKKTFVPVAADDEDYQLAKALGLFLDDEEWDGDVEKGFGPPEQSPFQQNQQSPQFGNPPAMQSTGAMPVGQGAPQQPPAMAGMMQPMGPNAQAPGMQTGGPQVPGPTSTPANPVPPPGMGMPGMGSMMGQVGTPPQLNLAQLPPEVIQYIQQLEKQVAQSQGQNSDSGADSSDSGTSSSNSDNSDSSNKPFGKSGAFNMNEDDTFYEELSKAIRDEDGRAEFSKALQTRFAAYEDQISKAQELAAQERDLRLEREFVAKSAEFSVPVAPEELGPVLKRAYESLSDEDFAVIVKVLDAATELADEVFGEVGKRGTGANDDIFSAVQAEAEELRKSFELSGEQAAAAVFEANPQAYDQYLQNRRGF